jgi:formylglycine-generating enzyme required for sulfatase activity
MGSEAGCDRDGVLADCLEAAERGDHRFVEATCRDHPELATAIQRAIEAASALSAHARGAFQPQAATGAQRRFGRFEIEGELGRGGSGVVLVARDRKLGRRVAIKVLAPGAAASADAVARFHREITALARVHHPNIASIHESGETEDGVPWFAMELLEGASLDAILRRHAGRDPVSLTAADLLPTAFPRLEDLPESPRPASWVEAVTRLGAAIADALASAHEAHLTHRDVKPGNILIDARGEPRLVDFGLAFDRDEATVTRTGATPGTPQYMAPEQVTGDRGTIGPWTDVYALGVTLYHALTLRAPFDGTTTLELFQSIRRDEPDRPRKLNRRIPRDLEVVLAKAMEKAPARRYASAAAFRDDLRAVLERRAISARRPTRIVRAARWVRRRPGRAAAIAAVLMALAAVGAQVGISINHENRADAAHEHYRELAKARDGEANTLDRQRVTLGAYLEESKRGEIAKRERDLAALHVECDETLARAADEYVAAIAWRRRSPLPTSRLKSELSDVIRQRSEDARIRGDLVGAVNLAKEADRIAPRSAEAPAGTVVFAIAPVETEIFLFRYEPYESLPGRETRIPRLVPVPIDPTGRRIDSDLGGFQPGDPCLVVTSIEARSPAAAEGLRSGDLIIRMGDFDPTTGVYVREVVSGSKADRSGVMPLDRVVSVAGRDADRLYVWESVKLQHDDAAVECVVETRVGGAVRLTTAPWRYLDAGTPESDPWLARLSRTERVTMRAKGLRETIKLAPVEEDLGLRVDEPRGLLRAPLPAPLQLTCVRDGQLLPHMWVEAGVAAGVAAEVTAYPLLTSTANRIDGRSSPAIRVPPGSYLAVLRAQGHVELRKPFVVESGPPFRITTTMIPNDEAPPGDFVYVDGGSFVYQRDPDVSYAEWPELVPDLPGFFIARFEVTMGQWWEFLEDPSVGWRVDSGLNDSASLLPRMQSGAYFGVGGVPLPDCKHPIPGQVALDSPVVGVSGQAIREFLSWTNARAEARGERWRYRLATQQEWEKAARGVDGRTFVWGNRFDFALCSSLIAHPRSQLDAFWLQPVGRFATDESPFGVRDMAGGAAELNDGVLAPDKRWEVWRGGSWDSNLPVYFRAACREADRTDMPNRGFRLVAE